MTSLRRINPKGLGVSESRRYTGASAADLMPWAILAEEGVVQTKSGAWVAGYFVSPPDTASSSDATQAHISDTVQIALSRFGAGWSLWGDAISIPAAPYPDAAASNFPNEVAKLVDEERRRAFTREGAHYDNERVICFSYTPPNEQVGRLQGMMYTGGDGEKRSTLSRYLETFQRMLEAFEDECGKEIRLRRMRGFQVTDQFGRTDMQDELVNYLSYCATGVAEGVIIPPYGAYLDSYIGGQDIEPGEVPWIGDSLVTVVTIEGFPAKSFPNIIASLSTLDIPYRFAQRAIFLDDIEAEKAADDLRKKWSAKVVPVMAKLLNAKAATQDEHAANMAVDAATAKALSKAGVRYCYYSATVVLRHAKEATLREMARLVYQTIRACGFTARIETTNTLEAWRGSLPGDTRSNVRRPPLHVGVLADLLPLSGIWTGETTAPCPFYPPGSPPLMFGRTVGSIPFRMNIHVGDVPHTVCFGPTGAGKSALMNSIALQALRYAGMRITAFDFKLGMFATVKACGGNHYNIGSDNVPLLCPLAHLETAKDRLEAEDFIAICFEVQRDRKPTSTQRMEISLAIKRLQQGTLRSLSDFVIAVGDKEVKEAVGYYTLAGSVGHLLDAERDAIEDSNFNCYEIMDLMGMKPEVNVPVLTVLFKRFERALDGSPAMLFISEAWQALGHPVWADKLQAWLRLLRSKNCAVLMDTQRLADAVKSNIMDLLIDSCPTKLYLPNDNAWQKGTPEQPGPLDLYRMMGLNDNQVSIIQGARRKSDVYWTSPLGCRLTAIDLGAMQLAIVGATGEPDVKEVQAFVREYGEGEWVWAYLKHKGVDYASLR